MRRASEDSDWHALWKVDDYFLGAVLLDACIPCIVLAGAGRFHQLSRQRYNDAVRQSDRAVGHCFPDRGWLIRAVNRAWRIVNELRASQRIVRSAGLLWRPLLGPGLIG